MLYSRFYKNMINLIDETIRIEWQRMISNNSTRIYDVLDTILYPFQTLRLKIRRIELTRINYFEDTGRYLEIINRTKFRLTTDRNGIVSSTEGNIEHILKRLQIKYYTSQWMFNTQKILFDIL